jgi:hypothetical protein
MSGNRGYSKRALALGIAISIVSLASGCGQKNQPDEMCVSKDFATAQAQAKSSQVACFSDSDCNPSVAMISAAWSTPQPGVTLCTGFLVAPDILATNSHCLPGDLSAPGASCADRLWGFFPPMSGFSDETVECESVISTTGHSETVPEQDIAFLRLKARSTRPALHTSRDGFPENALFSVVKVNPEPNGCTGRPLGQMQTVQCQAVQNSAYLPAYNDPQSPVVAFGTNGADTSAAACAIIHGNSGSPVLDSRGNAVGIIQAIFNSKSTDPNQLLDDGHAQLLAMGTSFACVQSPVDTGGSYSSACNHVPGPEDDQDTKRWGAVVTQHEQASISSEIEKWSSSEGTGSQWKSTTLPRNSTLIPADARNTSGDSYVVPALSCGQGRGAAPTSLEIPILHFRTGFDRYLVPDFRDDGAIATVRATVDSDGSSLIANDSSGNPIRIPCAN